MLDILNHWTKEQLKQGFKLIIKLNYYQFGSGLLRCLNRLFESKVIFSDLI